MKKSNLLRLLWAVLVVMLLPVGNSFGQEAYAVFEDGTLTLKYDDQKPTNAYSIRSSYSNSWANIASNINQVVFDDSFKDYPATSCAYWFYYCTNLAEIVGMKDNLNTASVTDMSWMFCNCSNLTSLDLSGFDTHSVTDISGMFSNCSKLTSLDVSEFDTKNVTDISGMFSNCSNLTSLDVSGFDTKNVTDISGMFSNCSILTSLDLSGFDTHSVTDISRMFSYCSKLKTIYVGDNWTTDNVTNSNDMFRGCNKLYGGKGTSIYDLQSSYYYDDKATDKTYAKIDGGESAPGYLTKSGEEPFECDAYAVLDNNTLTFYCNKNKPDNALEIGEIGIGNSYWKYNITQLVFDDSFKTYKPKNCKNWFYYCYNLTQIEGMNENLNTSDVKNMSGMFSNCSKLTSLDLSGFDTKNVTQMDSMFNNCSSLKNLDVSGFDTHNVTSMSRLFEGCRRLTRLDLSGFDTQKVTNMSYMFDYCDSLKNLDLSGFDTKNVTNMSAMFCYCDSLKSLDLSSFDTQNVTDMRGMFGYCRNLKSLDLSGFNTKNVTSMSYMFEYCKNLKTIFVGDYWSIDNVNDSWYMFSGCNNLCGENGSSIYDYELTDKTYAKIDGGDSDPGYLTQSNGTPFVNDAYAVLENNILSFYYDKNRPENAIEIGEIGLSYTDWKSNVTNVVFTESFKNYKPKSCKYWFNGCNNLTEIQGINEYLNTENVTNMDYMFYNCSNLLNLNLSGFVTNSVTDMSNMFSNCRKLKTIIVGDNWITDNVTNSWGMFYGCYKLYGGKGTTLYDLQSDYYDNKATDKTYATIDGGESAPGYLTKSGENPFECDAYAVLDNNTLTFYFNKNKPDNAFEIGEVGSVNYIRWKFDITKVVFDESFKSYKPKTCKGWFNGCYSLAKIEGMKENLNTSEVKNMSGMFSRCFNLTSIDLSGFVTKNVTLMDSMFCDCRSLTNLDVSSFDTHNVTSLSRMFEECSSLTSLDLSKFDTKKVTDMSSMFTRCSNLKTIYVDDKWTTDNITESYSIFYDCENLIGGKGTTYTSQNIGKQFAIIDGGESEPGYLTKITPISLAINTQPSKTEYIEGEKLDLTDGEMLVTYNNETTKIIALNKATISNYDNTTIGEQIIKVSYCGVETFFKVTIVAKSPVAIAISTLPTKLEYIEKEELDLSNGVLLVTYNNETTEKVALNKTSITGFDNTKIGEQIIKVSYLGLETYFIVTVTSQPIAIAIAYYPQLSYTEGEQFSAENGYLRVIYNNSKIDTVALAEAVIDGYNPNKIGEQILTIRYLGLTTDLKVNVNQKQIINPYTEPKLVVNIYYISSFEELFWFMFDVNHGDVKANAALVNDIIINKDCLKRITEILKSTSKAASVFTPWQPIGTTENPYQGTFDGQGHTISGIYIDDNTQSNVGLFGSTAKDAVIKNLGVTDSYIAGNENVGAICGKAEGTVVNCYTVSEVKGNKNVNALVGDKEPEAVVENCYYLTETPIANDPCAKTAEEFKSGAVAQLLSQGAIIDGVTYSGENFANITKLPGTDIIQQPENNDNPSTSISSISENNIKVWSFNHTIYIENAPADTKYTIIDINGRVIATSNTKSTREEINTNKSGIMILNIGNQSFKIAQ